MESESAELQNMRRMEEYPEPEAEERDRDLVCTGSDRPFLFRRHRTSVKYRVTRLSYTRYQ